MAKKISVRGENDGERPAHPLVVRTVEVLRARQQTIAFAESCTGGLLSAIFTRMPGVSDVFKGSIVAYSYDVKESLLRVPSPMLRSMGAVSLPVARKMAEGARLALGSTWTLAITGVAGPGGGTPAKPVGTVCFAISGPGVDKVIQRNFSGTRREIQSASAKFALKILLWELGVGARSSAQAKVHPTKDQKKASESKKVAKRN